MKGKKRKKGEKEDNKDGSVEGVKRKQEERHGRELSAGRKEKVRVVKLCETKEERNEEKEGREREGGQSVKV